jgi:hypothetical protein
MLQDPTNMEKPIDSIVESIIAKFKQRSDIGIQKYGKTLDRTDLNYQDWLNHIQEELMDAILYCERLKKETEHEFGRGYFAAAEIIKTKDKEIELLKLKIIELNANTKF